MIKHIIVNKHIIIYASQYVKMEGRKRSGYARLVIALVDWIRPLTPRGRISAPCDREAVKPGRNQFC